MWNDADLYDLENADDPAFDLGFWESLVRDLAPRRVLELACGTGRVTLPLARLGVAYELVALDRSEPFLAQLRSRLAGETLATGVSVVHGDMRSPQVDGPFDLIAVPFNSLAYLTSRESRIACLRRRARRCSLPAGASRSTSSPRATTSSPRGSSGLPPLRVDADHPAPENGVARFVRSYTDTYDRASQTLRSTNRYEIYHEDGRVEHRIADLDWHIYFPEELELLLSRRRADRGGALRRLRARPVGRGLEALSVVGCAS